MEAAEPYDQPLNCMEEEADLDLFLMNCMEEEADSLVPPPPDLTSAPLGPPPLPPRPTPTPSNASNTSGAASPSSGISSVTEGARSSSSSPFSPRLKTNTTKQKASSSNNRSTSFMAEVAAAGAVDAATAAAAAAAAAAPLSPPPPPYTVGSYPLKSLTQQRPSYSASAPDSASSTQPLPRPPLADISPRPSRTSHPSFSSTSYCNSGTTVTVSVASSSPAITTATFRELSGNGGGGSSGGGSGGEIISGVGAGTGSSSSRSSSSSCNGGSGGGGGSGGSGGSGSISGVVSGSGNHRSSSSSSSSSSASGSVAGTALVSGGPLYPSLPPLSAVRATAPAAPAAATPAVPATAPAVAAAAAPAVPAAASAVPAAAPAVAAPASASSPALRVSQPVEARSSSYYSASAVPSVNGKRGSFNWNKLGRSVVGTVLGSGAVGKVADGGAGGKGGVGGGAPTRELSAPEMQQLPQGKVNVSVWRNNKQDAQPVKVQIGVYNSAYEGERAAEAFCPPKWQEPNKDSRCAVCDSTFGFVYSRRHHCRNCGRLVCSSCAEAFWPRSMLPSTYRVDTSEKKVRVCSTCHGASENFRKALLSGSEEGVMEAYSTGCVNLRAPYTIYRHELPVHCAAAGGNLNILAWLVEDRCCPLFFDSEKTIALGDSGKRSVIAAAAASGHIHIMRYLALTQGCKVTEIKDQKALWCALNKCMYEGGDVAPATEASSRSSRHPSGASPTVPGDDRYGGGTGGGDGSGGFGGGGGGGGGSEGGDVYPTAPPMPVPGFPNGAEVARAVSVDDKNCIVCFERHVDCTLVPCGHHCCCLICAAQFEQCPVCRAKVEQKIKAISV